MYYSNKDIIVKYIMQGMTQQQIADELGVSKTTVFNKMVHRGIRRCNARQLIADLEKHSEIEFVCTAVRPDEKETAMENRKARLREVWRELGYDI